MKIQFDDLDYQKEAVAAAVRVFEGQTIKECNFTITNNSDQGTLFTEMGIANRIIVDSDHMLKNVNKAQILNRIAPSENLYGTNDKFPQFNIEMETGTGKTFVYLKTILELNKEYGFLKFVIVVPSVAIKEGVLKNYQITKDYFKSKYDGVIYDLFMFDSSNLNRVRTFASANTIDVMVTTIQAFNKDTNVMNREHDKLSGARPIDLISETRPIVIIDEPQSVDNTPLAKEAISSLNPSVGFRYSATHRDTSYPTIYRLGAVEAYKEKLVKQIEVAGIHMDEDGNRAHMRLVSVTSNKSGISAQIEVYKKTKSDADKKTLKFSARDDMYTKTGLQVYEQVGFIQDIDATPGLEAVYFSGHPDKITLNSTTLEEEAVKRGQIAKTIEEHLEKELKFVTQGLRIKVLSLFFLDKVENYRMYDNDGNASLGKYAQIFEEEYNRLIRLPKYKVLSDINVPVKEVHDGYFSADKKGKLKDTNGSTLADESTYEMIMKNKEGLLTLYDEAKGNTRKANKIRFIFSHSALKEGWDNPNVFQIATLIDTKDTITKRQKIGRGLRIAVNESGERVPGFEVNTLTVMANESYTDFAEGLQKEYEEDGIVFGVFDNDAFATIITKHDLITDEIEVLGKEKSARLVKDLKEKQYISKSGHATDKLRQAIKDNTIDVDYQYSDYIPQILEIAESKIKSLEIKDVRDRVQIKPLKEALPDDFIELWNKIKYKTSYKIKFDTEELIKNVVPSEGANGVIGINSIQTRKGTYTYTKADMEITDGGIVAEETADYSVKSTTTSAYQLPDIITFLQNATSLTRKTIVAILSKVNNLNMFENNPLAYMNQVARIINAHKEQLIVDGIEYRRVDDYYEQSLFTSKTLEAYLGSNGNSFKVDDQKAKTLYDHIIVDSAVEKDFARDAELDDNVKFYVKLPDDFKIRTPLGNYNPDWAVLYEEENEQRLYFILETKGNTDPQQLRASERNKIIAGEKHFKAIDTDIRFKVINKEKEIRN
ncbi:DEAD/DEAH box helicase [Erysipelothrix rhusiopathiae]|uniref:restriction endonuclease n=1 Tax=Erysipelothrix rhusiopathiae TaxID=1648 RepID=UPI000CA204CE|nr:DEAD/DEAH box helicase family protein [Erysipelothrix rhusiopathiae]ASD51137.1 type III restriction enzyme res subunit [Erysipelothrix phage phi1605]QDS38480.1 DEAD/DEAH box helicase [Erysipelothrix rhusiopathiae]